jgi:plastocyanin
MASSTWSAPSATTTATSGSGCTHTVIVAPTQGVLRYVPFAINASVGDTIAFVWNANKHTVTKSSELAVSLHEHQF